MKITFALILIFAGLNAKAQKPDDNAPKYVSLIDLTTPMGSFQKALLDKIKYTGLAVENEHNGKLTALFIINKDRKIQYIKILKSPHDLISEAVIKALKNIEYPPVVKTDQPYILPINFKIRFVKYPPVSRENPFLPWPDSIQAKIKIPPAVSTESSMNYNPDNITMPSKLNPIILDEMTKLGNRAYGTETVN